MNTVTSAPLYDSKQMRPEWGYNLALPTWNLKMMTSYAVSQKNAQIFRQRP